MSTAEHRRLLEIHDSTHGWRRWGPYVSHRAWGTVREDYSADGDAWGYLTHDLARSKAYRWGEDAIAGFSDRYQLLVFAPAFWNGRDPILKERLFGLSGPEGNHGEDVKELYYPLDATPTHSYSRFLYKYPQAEFPYARLVAENAGRTTRDPEFELIDAGVFDEDRYFDIEVEYAKPSEEDLAIRIRATNRGPDPAPLHLIPQLWFRNTWAWGEHPTPAPRIRLAAGPGQGLTLVTDDSMVETLATVPVSYRIGARAFHAPPGGRAFFTENETNGTRVFGPGHRSESPFAKDAFHRAIVDGQGDAANPEAVGSKAAIDYRFDAVAPGQAVTLRFRLTDAVRPRRPPGRRRRPGRPPPGRGRRLLRRPGPRQGVGRRADDPAAGAFRPDLDQAGVLLRRQPLARGRQPGRPAAAGAAARSATGTGSTSTRCG